MAIQIDLATSNFGIPFAGAYFKIATASVLRQREIPFTVMIDVVGYATIPNDETREVDFRRYHTLLENIESQEGVEFLTKCYQWVMSQEDMLGSQAV